MIQNTVFALVIIFIRMQKMNKYMVLICCVWSVSVWGQQVVETPIQVDSTAEEEEIIGGIGGTGLRDMERPELLERPDFELDDLIDIDRDSSLEDASDALEDVEATTP